MPEVSAPRGANPADRTTARCAADSRTRIGGSVSFAELLQRPRGGPISANWPVVQADHSHPSQTGAEGPVRAPQARARRHAEETPEVEARPGSEPALDPFCCQLAVNQELGSFVQPNPAAGVTLPALPLREDLQNLLTGLARRVAWGGDRRKGSARIELSEGALAGATLVVHTERQTVSVELELPAGMAAQGWQERIAQRLEGRGFLAQVKVG